MKVLIGICGIGNGHINRQLNVVEYLLKNKNEVVIATTKNNFEPFSKRFKSIKILNIDIPWIICNEKGVNFDCTLNRYLNDNVDQYKSFLTFAVNVEKAFKGKPDLIITDYEPNVAQYSYATGVSLVCMEQQSKFLFLKEEKIKNFSIKEEKSRLNYFFPQYDMKIISSFFPIQISGEKIYVIPPIIKRLSDKKSIKGQVLVYFSPYADDPRYDEILDSINKINDLKFIVYSNKKFSRQYKDHIIFKNFGDGFKSDLEKSECLISTAGHQLISEAISVNVPLLLIPLNTYEQNYNALMVEKYKLGVALKSITDLEIKKFYEECDYYKKKITDYKEKFYKYDWEAKFDELIKKYK